MATYSFRFAAQTLQYQLAMSVFGQKQELIAEFTQMLEMVLTDQMAKAYFLADQNETGEWKN